MIISSGHLFAKQISGDTPPVPPTPPMDQNVYFEDGYFNPLLVPSGFNFASKRMVLTSDASTSSSYFSLAQRFRGGEWSSRFDDGTTSLIKTPSAGTQDWKIEDGKLVYEHNHANGDVFHSVFLPVINMTGLYDYLNVHIRLVASDPSSSTNFFWGTAYERDGNTLIAGEYASIYGDEVNVWHDTYCYVGDYEDRNIDFIEFSIYSTLHPTMDFKIEIDKVWGSND